MLGNIQYAIFLKSGDLRTQLLVPVDLDVNVSMGLCRYLGHRQGRYSLKIVKEKVNFLY